MHTFVELNAHGEKDAKWLRRPTGKQVGKNAARIQTTCVQTFTDNRRQAEQNRLKDQSRSFRLPQVFLISPAGRRRGEGSLGKG